MQTTGRQQLLKNEHANAWRTTILPHQPLALHRHDVWRIVFVLKGGILNVVAADGISILDTYDWPKGTCVWLGPDPPGQLHGDVLVTPDPMEVLVIEISGVGMEATATVDTSSEVKATAKITPTAALAPPENERESRAETAPKSTRDSTLVGAITEEKLFPLVSVREAETSVSGIYASTKLIAFAAAVAGMALGFGLGRATGKSNRSR
mmetsp:Transcript_40828/g.69382  ORF Transcript_40828/g.69382 Transcript_40828/m.69382 type:complete len:208 (-) Transcript_40828:214-837(-)